MDNTLYIVIYGDSHEDKALFADPEKANRKLLLQHLHKKKFSPFIEVYALRDGVYYKNKYGYRVCEDNKVALFAL